MDDIYRKTATNSLVTAALMLLVGFYLAAGLRGVSGSRVYDTSIEGFVTLMRLGGFALLAVAALAWKRHPLALRADVACSGLIGILMALIAGIWIYGAPKELAGYVAALFAFICLRTARDSYRLSCRPAAGPADAAAARPDASPPSSPASPRTLPPVGRRTEPEHAARNQSPPPAA